MDTHLTLQPIIHGAWEGHHLLLGWLNAQRHPPARCSAGGVIHHSIRHSAEGRVGDQQLVPLVKSLAGCAWEECFEIYEAHGSGASIPAIMPVQMLLQPLEMPMQPFIPLAGPVIEDHAGVIQRDQYLAAEVLVDLPVCDVRRIDGPHLSALTQRKMDAFPRLPSAGQDLPPAAGSP